MSIDLLASPSTLPGAELLPAVGLGVASHLGVFIHGEWHREAGTLLRLYLLLASLIFFYELIVNDQGRSKALRAGVSIIGCYNAGLFTSMTIYRSFFHCLRDFPGPKLARITKFWHIYQCRGSKNHLVLESLRREYGDYVRTGMSRAMSSLCPLLY